MLFSDLKMTAVHQSSDIDMEDITPRDYEFTILNVIFTTHEFRDPWLQSVSPDQARVEATV